MGRIKDLNSALPTENDAFVFDGANGTKRLSYAEFKQKLQDDGFGSGSSEAVVLTQAEYDALPDEVKDSDTIFFISDAPFENSNVVTLTRAQYDALSDATKMDGRFYYITDEEEVAKSLVVQTNVNSTETVPSSAVVYGLNESVNQKFKSSSVALTPNTGVELTRSSAVVLGDVMFISALLHITTAPTSNSTAFSFSGYKITAGGVDVQAVEQGGQASDAVHALRLYGAKDASRFMFNGNQPTALTYYAFMAAFPVEPI